jgi:hypothetical protein
MLEDAQEPGVYPSVSKQKSKTERVARRKTVVPPSEFLLETAPAPPPAPDPTLSVPPSFPSANGEEEAALARLADDGGPSSPTGETPIPPMPEPAAALSLEQRIQHLEAVVTLLQQGRAAVPAAPAPPPPTAIRIDLSKPAPAPAVPVAAIVADPAPIPASAVTRGSVLWLLWDTWAEARAIVRMFVDPRYRLPRSARLLPLLLLAAILTSEYWVPFSSLPVLGSWFVKTVDLVLAFLLFKWLGHEARRYRQTSPDLPANLRL